MSRRATTFVLAMSLFLVALPTCAREERVIDIRGVGGPALAFVVDVADGAPIKTSEAILLNDNGDISQGASSLNGAGDASFVVIVHYDALETAAGGLSEQLLFDELAGSILRIKTSTASRPVEEEFRWLSLPMPTDSLVRPTSETPPIFMSQLTLEVPLRRDFECSLNTELQDFEAEFTVPANGAINFQDLWVLSRDRAIAVSDLAIFDLRVGDALDTQTPSTRFIEIDDPVNRRYSRLATANMNDSTAWIAKRGIDTGADLLELESYPDGVRLVGSTPVPGMLAVTIAVAADGTVLMGGPNENENDRDVTVAVFSGSGAPELTHIQGHDDTHTLIAGLRPNTFVTGVRGFLAHYTLGDSQWSLEPLTKDSVPRQALGLAQRNVDGDIETWAVANAAAFLRESGGPTPDSFPVPVPPNFGCQSGGEQVELNFKDMVIFKDRYALISAGVCADVLVVDLDNPSCSSLIRYNGSPEGARPIGMQISHGRLWVWGNGGMLRYAPLDHL